MSKIVATQQLHELAGNLTKLLPGSLKVMGLIRSTAAGVMDMEIWVDQWPNYTAVIASPKNSKTIPKYIKNVYTVYSVPGQDVSGCASLMSKCGVINWSSPIVFGGIVHSLKSVITDAAKKRNCSIDIMDDCHLMAATEDTLITHDVQLPEGHTDGTLTSEDAELVTSRWKHGDVTAEEYVRFLITTFPTAAVRDAAGRAVAWFITQNYGAMGMLHVEPDYRGRSLAKHLIARLSKVALASGDPAFVIVEHDNVVSRQLHVRCGFRQLEGEDVAWVLVKPNGSDYQTKANCCV